jgi:hypothetical protein
MNELCASPRQIVPRPYLEKTQHKKVCGKVTVSQHEALSPNPIAAKEKKKKEKELVKPGVIFHACP